MDNYNLKVWFFIKKMLELTFINAVVSALIIGPIFGIAFVSIMNYYYSKQKYVHKRQPINFEHPIELDYIPMNNMKYIKGLLSTEGVKIEKVTADMTSVADVEVLYSVSHGVTVSLLKSKYSVCIPKPICLYAPYVELRVGDYVFTYEKDDKIIIAPFVDVCVLELYNIVQLNNRQQGTQLNFNGINH